MVGVETHRVLGLIDLDQIRPVMENPKAIYARVCAETERFVEKGVITEQQAGFVNRSMIARFFESELGRRVLQSSRVMREWAFNLRVWEPFPTTAQGVIDLCFLEDGAWVLVDFKTDRVQTESQLICAYAEQLSLYTTACEKIFGSRVKEKVIYSFYLKKFAKVL
jgi:ATP-dependent helicase/nuclease subunit A